MDIKTIIKRSIKILHIARKPTDDEYREVAKITSLGMLVIGIIGLIISIVLNLF